ncbi:MAG: phosphopantetheine-binding protein [Actinobacteria bacterium 13_2_20CM_2_71_6]|nr:MAG: phosphopantetheine-binding protein [Actinobacteria bacterium 13_2_20CM_2_71_6]
MTANPIAAAVDPRSIAERTRKVLAEMVGRDPASLTEDTRLFADLGMDSTNALELLMLLEDELGIRIDADNLEQQDLETLGSLTGYFARQAG